ncbi:MAG: branched-chain amino acid ABC transporter permease [Candidatus Rokubacteria bacterium]|nr:branched-chain amino acid ABC transporter permease [Candidatus Rokubacteria bacterium]
MTAEILVQAMVLGLLQGGIYALVAAGLTLIYGVMKVVNFAHAEFLTLGMYLAFSAYTLLGVSPYLAAVFALGLVFVLGAAVQRTLIRPALRHPQINQLLITIGLSTMLIGAMQIIWGPRNYVVPLPWGRATLGLGDLRVTYTRLIAFGVAVAIAAGFWVFLKRARGGLAIRAAAQSPDAARLMGINVERVNLVTFGLGTGLAALAGALIAPVFFINPTFGIDYFLLPAFVIVVLGTMGNFVGAMVGGLVIGLAESFGGLLLGAALRQFASLAVFVLILLWLPRGVFGGRMT